MEEFLSIDSNWIVKFFYTYVDKVIYSFHMPIYMIISGVLASYALCVKSQKEYIIDRFNRLMVSFILCGVLYAVPIKYISGFYYEWSLIKSYI